MFRQAQHEKRGDGNDFKNNSMRNLILSLLFITTSCGFDMDKFKEECPFDFIYSWHYLELPVQFEPNQMTYSVGDTVHVNVSFDDKIYDFSAQDTFTIIDFPFKPAFQLYKIEDISVWTEGLEYNEVIIDSIYQPVYLTGSQFSNSYHSKHFYAENRYNFEFELVLNTPGRYVFIIVDEYEENQGSHADVQNAEADANRWEGRCELPLTLAYLMEGDAYLQEFKEEIRFLDTVIYRDRLTSLFDENLKDHLDRGATPVELDGFRGFEVVE
jgi:hypothetical protein